MKNNKGMLLGVALAFCSLLFISGDADAIVYDFHGTCTTLCTGDAYVEFLLDDSYVPGTLLQCGNDLPLCPLLRIHYVDSTEIDDYDYRKDGGAGLVLSPSGFILFPAVSGPSSAGFGLVGGMKDDFPFYTRLDGTWLMFTEYGYHLTPGRYSEGINGFYTLASHAFTPEPSTAALLLAVALLIGFRRRAAILRRMQT